MIVVVVVVVVDVDVVVVVFILRDFPCMVSLYTFYYPHLVQCPKRGVPGAVQFGLSLQTSDSQFDCSRHSFSPVHTPVSSLLHCIPGGTSLRGICTKNETHGPTLRLCKGR